MKPYSFVLDSNTVVDELKYSISTGLISGREAQALEEWLENSDADEVHQCASQALQIACDNDDLFLDAGDRVVSKAIGLITGDVLNN